MKRDFLKSLGLEQEVVDKIIAENGKDIESLKSSNAALQTELTTIKDQLANANAQIDKFKDLDFESVKQEAADWKTKATNAAAEAAKQVAAVKRDYAINGALSAARAKNNTAVKALLNLDAVTLTDSGLVGLEEQLLKVKEENGYLFEADAASSAEPKRVVGHTPGAKDIPSDDNKTRHARANSAMRDFFNRKE